MEGTLGDSLGWWDLYLLTLGSPDDLDALRPRDAPKGKRDLEGRGGWQSNSGQTAHDLDPPELRLPDVHQGDQIDLHVDVGLGPRDHQDVLRGKTLQDDDLRLLEVDDPARLRCRQPRKGFHLGLIHLILPSIFPIGPWSSYTWFNRLGAIVLAPPFAKNDHGVSFEPGTKQLRRDCEAQMGLDGAHTMPKQFRWCVAVSGGGRGSAAPVPCPPRWAARR